MLSNIFDLQFIIFYVLFFVPSLVIHEFSHAFTAYKLGDNTAKDMGRLTLNPLVHLDLFGTLAIFLIGFGWAKPVPINPYNFKNIRRDTALVSLAGPLSNFLIGGFGLLILYLGFGQNIPLLSLLLVPLIQINFILGIFNLIPLGPLDGFKIVSGLLPTELAVQWEHANQLSFILLFILLFLPINGSTLVDQIINLISHFIFSAIL